MYTYVHVCIYLCQTTVLTTFSTKSKLETHSQKHIHGNTFGNTFVEIHSNFELSHLKMKQKSFKSPIPLKTSQNVKPQTKKSTKASLSFEFSP